MLISDWSSDVGPSDLVEDTVNTRITTRMRWAGLLATTALVASGCASSADNDSKDKSDDGIDYTTRMMNVSEPKGEPVKGGTLRVAEYSEARGFNPTQTYPTGSTGGNILAALYDTQIGRASCRERVCQYV